MLGAINYKHLHYFWVVAHEGSIARASQKLHITPQTISGQLSCLEDSFGQVLFERSGRKLRLTQVGRMVLRYADEIFELGRELSDVLRGEPAVGPVDFIVSAISVLPKTVVYKIIEPALNLPHDVRVICKEGPIETVISDLAMHKVDLVLADTPLATLFGINAYNHLLGESGLSFFAEPTQAKRLRKGFPQSLEGESLLVPSEQNAIRREFDHWLAEHRIYPKVKGIFDDSSLLKAFGQTGLGVFFLPSIIEAEVCRNYGVRVIARTDEIKQSFYAISLERKIRHPAIAAICTKARGEIFL